MSLKAYISKSFYEFSMNSFMKLMIKCMHLEHTLTKKQKKLGHYSTIQQRRWRVEESFFNIYC